MNRPWLSSKTMISRSASEEKEFVVKRGQRLRAAVNAWPDEQSMKTDKQAIQLTNPAFECS